MKVALFHPHNTLGGWVAVGGYRAALERMGHEVLDAVLPGNTVANVDVVRSTLPTIVALAGCDVIISAFHEYTAPWLEALYGFEAWKPLINKTVARFDESMDRMDLGLPGRLPELMKWALRHAFAAAQDARKYKGDWIPFSADTEMFSAERGMSEKPYDVAFIGSLYPLRRKYLEHLARFADGTRFNVCDNVGLHRLDGAAEPESTMLLAEEYRKVKIFFCLPTISRLFASKAFEVMACGTFVMHPQLPGELAENCSLFEHKKHLVYYKAGYFQENLKQIKHYLEHEDEREQIANTGMERVRSHFTIELMLNRMLDSVRLRPHIVVSHYESAEQIAEKTTLIPMEVKQL